MSDLPRRIGMLGGIVAFCAAMMVGLLRDCPPLETGRKALIGAVLLAVVARVGAQLALSVVREGMRQYHRDRSESA
ncbi:MAG: hypothetical protein R6X33_02945 [Candidatus Brocadiia bacterium]